MKLDSLKVKNFRTIKTEQTIDLCRSLTIVGPNNSGKTNILKAIEMFFTGHDNKHQYSIDDDLSFHVENEQTSLSAIFSSDDSDTDKSLLDLYCAMNQMLEEPNSIDGKFTLNLYFTKTGKPVYRFNYKKVKKEHKEEFDEKQLSFVSLLLNSFECHYVPSSKTTTELYSLLLLPFIKRSIAQILEDKVIEINENLRLISDSLDEQMTLSGLCHIKSHFEISKGSLKDLINDFDFYLSDPNKTLINKKGMGIQAAAIFSSFLWITKEERKIGKNVIWLIEEPESYLHPALAESCHNMLNGLREDALLITTTHSLGFVSKDYRQIVGVEVDSGCTNIRKYSSYLDATSSIREALGIRFSDYYNLGEINLFVEGKTDREILKWFLNFIKPKANEKYLWLYVRQANFYEFGGVKGITGFMKATYEHVSKERVAVALFDGDKAGLDSVKELNGYFGNKQTEFESNKNYVLIPNGFSIEGLFPLGWIMEAYCSNKNWFNCPPIRDAMENILSFEVVDKHKANLQSYLMKRAEESIDNNWIVGFEGIVDALEKALSTLYKKIYKKELHLTSVNMRDRLARLLIDGWIIHKNDKDWVDVSSVEGYIKKTDPDFLKEEFEEKRLREIISGFDDILEMTKYKGTFKVRQHILNNMS